MTSINIPKLLDIFSMWLDALGDFWIYLNTPIINLSSDHFSPSLALVRGFLNLVGAGNFTLLEFIVGPAITFFIVWTLLTWFLNFIT